MTTALEPDPEASRAREALLELLATTLDAALPVVTDRRRTERLPEIAELCQRIRFLGETAARV